MILENKREKGNFYERMACDWLVKKGYKIIETNYQASHTEIDIVVLKKDILCIIEVKYRKIKNCHDEAMAYYSVGQKKQKNLIKATKIFLMKTKEYVNYFQRFDVFLILDNGFSQKIQHITDAFRER